MKGACGHRPRAEQLSTLDSLQPVKGACDSLKPVKGAYGHRPRAADFKTLGYRLRAEHPNALDQPRADPVDSPQDLRGCFSYMLRFSGCFLILYIIMFFAIIVAAILSLFFFR